MNFTSLFDAVNAMAVRYDMPVLYSCHPRSRRRLYESMVTTNVSAVMRSTPLSLVSASTYGLKRSLSDSSRHALLSSPHRSSPSRTAFR